MKELVVQMNEKIQQLETLSKTPPKRRRGRICYSCSKEGHFTPNCPDQKNSGNNRRGLSWGSQSSNQPYNQLHWAHHVISTFSKSGVYVSGIVNHRKMSILLDSGSIVCIISEEIWKKSGTNGVNLQPVHRTFTSASGSTIVVLGETGERLRIGDTRISFPVIVARNISHDCLLRIDFLS